MDAPVDEQQSPSSCHNWFGTVYPRLANALHDFLFKSKSDDSGVRRNTLWL